MLLQEKLTKYGISRIISGDWDKYSEEYGSNLCTESDLSREDPFEIQIRSTLSRTLYNEKKQDNWLKTNLLGIFDKDNNKEKIKAERTATYKERADNQEPESKKHDDNENKKETDTINLQTPKDLVSSLDYTSNQEEGLGYETQQIKKNPLKKKRKKKFKLENAKKNLNQSQKV